LFANQLLLGLAQAATVMLLMGLITWVARRQSIHLEQEIGVAVVRGFLQVVVTGSALLVVFQSTRLVGLLVLLAMIVMAALIAQRRTTDIPGSFGVALYSIGGGAGTILIAMTWLGLIDPALSSLIPVGSMIIASAMKVCALALERFKAEVAAHVGLIESSLALGARPATIVTPYAHDAIAASLIPMIDSMRSLGIVWIPGLMTGMILTGTDPLYAALYQFVVLGMILATSALTALLTGLLIRSHIFTPAEQLQAWLRE
ncbi:MAG: ABC transporter permease, partial [Chloroflexota bacterium]|nr:ABC transporter permease [Chloroflexota bacterium]